MRRKFWVGLCAMGLGLGISANTTYAAPDTPKTADTKPSAPKKVDVPPGYEKVSDKGFNILCEPNDKAWVTKALADYKAADRVKGGPADMLKSFAEKNRALLVGQMKTDLGIADDKAINSFLDEKIVPTLQKLDTLKVPVFYLVTTPEKLGKLTENGWGEPKFHYNRVAKAAVFDDNLNISLDQPMDEQIRVAFYNDKDSKETADDRAKGLANYLAQQDVGIYNALAQQAPGSMLGLFTTWLDEKQLAPMFSKRDQDWFRWGVVNYLACKYSALVTDVPKDTFLNALLTENQYTQVRAYTVDLLKPTDKDKIVPILQPHYEAALQRKGLAVVKYWLDKATEAELPKMLAAVKDKKPADGAALVKLIDDTTKVDLSKAMAAQ